MEKDDELSAYGAFLRGFPTLAFVSIFRHERRRAKPYNKRAYSGRTPDGHRTYTGLTAVHRPVFYGKYRTYVRTHGITHTVPPSHIEMILYRNAISIHYNRNSVELPF